MEILDEDTQSSTYGTDISYQGGIVGHDRAGLNGGSVNVYNCWSKGINLNKGIIESSFSADTAVVKNCYYIGDGDITSSTESSNNKQTTSWDNFYAYTTIGQNAYLNSSGDAIADIRWNNANTDNGKWFIHVESGGTIMGSFAGSYYIGTYCEDSTACDYGEMGSCSVLSSYILYLHRWVDWTG